MTTKDTQAVEAILKAELLTIPQTSILLGVEEQTVRNWVERDQIPYLRLPNGKKQGWLRIPKQELLGTLILNLPEQSTEKVQ